MPATSAGRSSFYGAGMSSAIETLDNMEQVDEALRHLSLVPPDERGPAWHAYLDAILETRPTLPVLTDKDTP